VDRVARVPIRCQLTTSPGSPEAVMLENKLVAVHLVGNSPTQLSVEIDDGSGSTLRAQVTPPGQRYAGDFFADHATFAPPPPKASAPPLHASPDPLPPTELVANALVDERRREPSTPSAPIARWIVGGHVDPADGTVRISLFSRDTPAGSEALVYDAAPPSARFE
jgi:hypothetical protein